MLLDILYPPVCMHCSASLEKSVHFCEECLDQFTLLPEEGHCIKCFAEIANRSGVCKACRKMHHPMRRVGACFERFGPAQSLLRAFLREGRYTLAKEIAAFIVVQIHALSWPQFELVTAVPNFFKTPQYLIGKEIAKLLQIPFISSLRRKLTVEPEFILKNKCNILVKRVLLLDTSLEAHANLRFAAMALKEGSPLCVYGITFCSHY